MYLRKVFAWTGWHCFWLHRNSLHFDQFCYFLKNFFAGRKETKVLWVVSDLRMVFFICPKKEVRLQRNAWYPDLWGFLSEVILQIKHMSCVLIHHPFLISFRFYEQYWESCQIIYQSLVLVLKNLNRPTQLSSLSLLLSSPVSFPLS